MPSYLSFYNRNESVSYFSFPGKLLRGSSTNPLLSKNNFAYFIVTPRKCSIDSTYVDDNDELLIKPVLSSYLVAEATKCFKSLSDDEGNLNIDHIQKLIFSLGFFPSNSEFRSAKSFLFLDKEQLYRKYVSLSEFLEVLRNVAFYFMSSSEIKRCRAIYYSFLKDPKAPGLTYDNLYSLLESVQSMDQEETLAKEIFTEWSNNQEFISFEVFMSMICLYMKKDELARAALADFERFVSVSPSLVDPTMKQAPSNPFAEEKEELHTISAVNVFRGNEKF
jgi:Ca2+-binding EF-hand superfamily protein